MTANTAAIDESAAPQDMDAAAPVDLAITQDDVRLIEAILFAAPAPIGVAQLAERFPADRASLIPDILDIIRDQYAGRGVNLVQRDDKYALRTATDLGDALRLEKDQPRKFTRAAMETMAIIAYHQPVTRAEIENIRGVATSTGALDALMEAGWIKPGKRREVPGRPVTWLTTQAFLDHFGLERIEDLPGMEDLKAAGMLDKRPAIEAIPATGDLFDESAQRDLDMVPEVTDEDLLGQPGEDAKRVSPPVASSEEGEEDDNSEDSDEDDSDEELDEDSDEDSDDDFDEEDMDEDSSDDDDEEDLDEDDDDFDDDDEDEDEDEDDEDDEETDTEEDEEDKE